MRYAYENLCEPLYHREALVSYGVEADHVLIWQVAGKLKRRHGLVLAGSRGSRGIAWRTGPGRREG